jgi:hypothetical protein
MFPMIDGDSFSRTIFRCSKRENMKATERSELSRLEAKLDAQLRETFKRGRRTDPKSPKGIIEEIEGWENFRLFTDLRTKRHIEKLQRRYKKLTGKPYPNAA